jgi:hypothetical protein
MRLTVFGVQILLAVSYDMKWNILNITEKRKEKSTYTHALRQTAVGDK